MATLGKNRQKHLISRRAANRQLSVGTVKMFVYIMPQAKEFIP